MTRRVLATCLAAAVLLAGCSGGKSGNGPGKNPGNGPATTAAAVNGVQQVTVKVGDNFRFDPSTITVHPGKVTLTLVHDGQGAPHDWALPQFAADHSPLVNAGQTISYTFTTPAPGRYQFVCTLHVAQGMTGTLVVTPN